MSKHYHILVVDDDVEIRDLLAQLLTSHRFKVSVAANGVEMFEILEKNTVDLALLDIMLDNDNGLELCKKIRKHSAIPIIMISALGNPIQRVSGLEIGADDYIAKPFYSEEVIARIKSVLRRNEDKLTKSNVTNSVKSFAGWKFNINTLQLFSPDNVEVCLSSGELALLEALLACPNKVISRDQLLSYLHGEHESKVFDRSIDVQISRLRKCIEINSRSPTIIETVRGKGYIFKADVK